MVLFLVLADMSRCRSNSWLGTIGQQSMDDGLITPNFLYVHMIAEIKLKQTNKKTPVNPNLLPNDICFIPSFEKY